MVVVAVVVAVASAQPRRAVSGLALAPAGTSPTEGLFGKALIAGAEVARPAVAVGITLHADVSRAIVEAAVALAASGALHTLLGRGFAVVSAARAMAAAGTVTGP